MKRVIVFLGVLIGVGMLIGTAAQAQGREDLLARYLKTDLASKQTEVMSSGMLLSREEGEVFWPAYKQYQQELTQLNDTRQTLITQYVKEYKNLDDAKAKELMEGVFGLLEQRLVLLRKYAAQMQQKLPGALVGKFVQLELQMQRVMDLQLNIELPPLK